MDYQQFAQDIVQSAVRAGAHQAEVLLQVGQDFNALVRMRELETLTQAGSKGLGLRVFVDKRMAFASTTDFDCGAIEVLVKNVVRLAKSASRDRFNGLPDVGPVVLPHLDLYDPEVMELPSDTKIEMAKLAEAAAFSYDARITNSEGSSFGSRCSTRVIANSNGISYTDSSTECDVSCVPMVEQNGERQIAHHWSAKCFLRDLGSPSDIGREAAVRAVRRLGARKVETQVAPVIFDWTIGPTILWPIFSALDGDAVHRGMSFLKKMIGKQVASPLVTVMDDPLMPRGLGSMTFDGEGVPTRTKTVIENGVLKLYFYDARTGRKYGESPTGNARRGYSSVPAVMPTNFYMRQSETDTSDIIRGTKNGFLVTETIGRGANVVTGDFSVGASGIWIKDGEPAFPVQEVTIAGNLLDMMKNIEAVANDAKFISSVVTPTFKIAAMTVSGR